MGTRSLIAARNEDGSFTSIYCHWDGYPSNNGVLLHDNYKDEAKVRQLLSLGDLSALDAEIGEKHDFDEDGRGCTFYGRDRGETGIDSQSSPSLEALGKLCKDRGGEYLYVYQDGAWFCAAGGMSFFGNPSSAEPGALRPIDEVLANQSNE